MNIIWLSVNQLVYNIFCCLVFSEVFAYQITSDMHPHARCRRVKILTAVEFDTDSTESIFRWHAMLEGDEVTTLGDVRHLGNRGIWR